MTYVTVPVDTLERLAASEDAKAAAGVGYDHDGNLIPMTVAERNGCTWTAEGYRAAIQLEMANRERAASQPIPELQALNQQADDVSFRSLCWILGIAGFALGIGIAAYFIQPGGHIYQWLLSTTSR